MTEKNFADRLKSLSYAERQRADGKWPAVLRMAGMKPSDVKSMIMHAERKARDESHTDPRRRHLNETLIGSNEIGIEIDRECAEMMEFNKRSNELGLKKMGRKKDLERLRLNGPGDPWSGSNNSDGPLREFIISVHRDFFKADDDCPPEFLLEFLDDEGELARHDLRKHAEFKRVGKKFVEKEFGEACVYLRYDLDEQSGHFHGILSDRVQEPASLRHGHGRWLYRTTHHRCVGGVGDERRGYEVAQDVIADWFDREEYRHLNIVRGEQRAKQKREAVKVIDEALKAEDLRPFFGDEQAEKIPDGSVQARRRWMAKKLKAEAASRSGKLRIDARYDLALDLLEVIGVLDPQVRNQHQKRRAMEQLLKQFEQSHGTPEELIANADAILSGSIEKARADIMTARIEADRKADADRKRKDEEAAERRQEADQLAELARQDQDRRAAEKRAEADRRATVQRRWDDRRAEADRRQRERALRAFERALGAREAMVRSDVEWVSDAMRSITQISGLIQSAAARLGLSSAPQVRDVSDVARRLDAMLRGRGEER